MLTSNDTELKKRFDKYLLLEYKGDRSKRMDYIDIAEIARFVVDKTKAVQQIRQFNYGLK